MSGEVLSPTITPTTTPTTEDGDHERFAHIVRKDKLTEAMVLGIAIKALCGKEWIPSRDPEKYPVCPTCMERYAMGMRP